MRVLMKHCKGSEGTISSSYRGKIHRNMYLLKYLRYGPCPGGPSSLAAILGTRDVETNVGGKRKDPRGPSGMNYVLSDISIYKFEDAEFVLGVMNGSVNNSGW